MCVSMFKEKVAITAKQVLHVMFGDGEHEIDPGFIEQSVKFLSVSKRKGDVIEYREDERSLLSDTSR